MEDVFLLRTWRDPRAAVAMGLRRSDECGDTRFTGAGPGREARKVRLFPLAQEPTLQSNTTVNREREWAAAEERFQRCLEMRPADRPSAIYMERIAEMRRCPPPADWDGVWHLSKK